MYCSAAMIANSVSSTASGRRNAKVVELDVRAHAVGVAVSSPAGADRVRPRVGADDPGDMRAVVGRRLVGRSSSTISCSTRLPVDPTRRPWRPPPESTASFIGGAVGRFWSRFFVRQRDLVRVRCATPALRLLEADDAAELREIEALANAGFWPCASRERGSVRRSGSSTAQAISVQFTVEQRPRRVGLDRRHRSDRWPSDAVRLSETLNTAGLTSARFALACSRRESRQSASQRRLQVRGRWRACSAAASSCSAEFLRARFGGVVPRAHRTRPASAMIAVERAGQALGRGRSRLAARASGDRQSGRDRAVQLCRAPLGVEIDADLVLDCAGTCHHCGHRHDDPQHLLERQRARRRGAQEGDRWVSAIGLRRCGSSMRRCHFGCRRCLQSGVISRSSASSGFSAKAIHTSPRTGEFLQLPPVAVGAEQHLVDQRARDRGSPRSDSRGGVGETARFRQLGSTCGAARRRIPRSPS